MRQKTSDRGFESDEKPALRVFFCAPLAHKPLHADTLAGLEAECQGALQLAFFVVELLGRIENGRASEQQAGLLRLLTPIAKFTTAKQAVVVLAEAIESFGGAGYVEDTGLPLRDALVLPIWEGAANVPALDVLRALPAAGGIAILQREARSLLQGVREKSLIRIAALVEQALEGAAAWLVQAQQAGEAETEAGARGFALTLGRAFELALLARQAQWSSDNQHGGHALAAARRFSAAPVNLIAGTNRDDSAALLAD